MTHPKTLAVIRVFSSADQKVLEKHAKIIEKLYGIPTRTYCIPNQPEGIANEEIAKDCVERIVEQCLRAEKDGADAVLVSCAIDPGVEAARKVCRIPVFGAGSCAAAMALTMGSRVGVLSLIAGDVPSVPRSILGDRMVAAVGNRRRERVGGDHFHQQVDDFFVCQRKPTTKARQSKSFRQCAQNSQVRIFRQPASQRCLWAKLYIGFIGNYNRLTAG